MQTGFEGLHGASGAEFGATGADAKPADVTKAFAKSYKRTRMDAPTEMPGRTCRKRELIMPTHRFREITHKVTKKIPCRSCGKTLTRSTTLSQTVNPFNRNADGEPKTVEEIRAELKAEAEAWKPANDIHAECAALDEIEINAWGDSMGAGYRYAQAAVEGGAE